MTQSEKPGKGAGGLKRRVMRSSGITMANMGVMYLFRFGSNLVLTWLLVPEAFGLMAMVTTLHTALQLFTDIGLRQSVVRSERGEEAYFLQVAWTIQVIRGLVVGGVVLLAGAAMFWLGDYAPADSVYADPMLPGMIMISCIVPAAEAARTANLWVAERKMILGRVLVFSIVARTIGLTVTVILALIFRSAWALVLGLIFGQVCRTLLSHVMIPGPKMAFVRDRALSAELWGFGRWILISSVFSFFGQNADRIIMGGLLDKTTFGFYVIAMLWVDAAAGINNRLVSKIGLAVFSEVIRKHPERLKRAYFRFSLGIDAIAVSASLAVLFVAPLLIGVLYKPDYLVAAAMIPFLFLRISVQRFVLPNMLILAHGDSAQMMIASGLRALASVAFLLGGHALFGIPGALVGASLVPLAATPFNIYKAARYGAAVVWYDIAWCVVILVLAGLLVSGALVPDLPAAVVPADAG